MRKSWRDTVSADVMRDVLVAVGLTALAAAGRLLPHEPNFTPVAACALFAGFLLRRNAWAAAPVLVGMYLSDLFIGGYDARIMAVVYVALCLPMFLGRALSRTPGVLGIGLAALGGSTAFFVSSNFAVWLFTGMYAKSAAGLVECFTAALPFFRFTVAGDLCWTAALFGGYAIAMALRGRLVLVPRLS